MAIEREVFAFPWSAAMMRDSVQAAHCEAWGAFLPEGSLIGYGILSVVLDEAELLDLAVAKAQQRKGFGEQLLNYLLAQAQDAGAESVYLEVRLSHEAAQNLYKKAGFVQVGKRRDYYPLPNSEQREDAVLMSIKLENNKEQ
jgi:ribosomal-protein-alanine N-acetyltransferase